MIHRLTYSGGAQAVRTVVLRDDGRAVVPASATYAVVDLRYDADDASHTVESGNATVDSVSTTTSAACGRGTSDPRSITVTSATGIAAGRRYLLSYGGRSELVSVAAVSSTTARLHTPVRQAFVSGASFLGVELSATLTSGTCGEEDYLDQPNILAVKWTPSGYPPYVEAIHLERLAPAPLVSPDEVLRLDPTLHAYLDDGMSAEDALRQARDDFDCAMLSHGIDDDEILAGPIGRRAQIYGAAWHILKASTEQSAVNRAQSYATTRDNLIANLVQGAAKKKVAGLTSDEAKAPDSVKSRFAVRW